MYGAPIPSGNPEIDAMYMSPICPGEMFDPPCMDDIDFDDDAEPDDQE